jgi:hypothetical protein
MCGADDLLPRVGGELPLGEGPADVVVQDLGGRPGDRVEPARLRFGEEFAEEMPSLVAPLRISIGLNACRWIPGTRSLTARTRSK